jgi:predicted aspartyl protease
MARILQRVSVLLPAALALAAAPAGRAQVADVPVDIASHLVFLKGRVNGQGPFTFILDSGATDTVLTPAAAGAAGVRRPVTILGRRRVVADALVVGGLTVSNLPVRVFDPPQALPLRLDHGLNYHGLLGYTFLTNFVTTLDYRARRVRFDAGAGASGSAQPGVPLRVREGLTLVEARVNDVGPLTFAVDTGSAEVVLLPAAARRLRLAPVPSAAEPGVGFAALGRLAVGEAEVRNVPVVVHAAFAEDRSAPGYDGILGAPFLSNFVVTLDYRDRRLTLTPY